MKTFLIWLGIALIGIALIVAASALQEKTEGKRGFLVGMARFFAGLLKIIGKIIEFIANIAG